MRRRTGIHMSRPATAKEAKLMTTIFILIGLVFVIAGIVSGINSSKKAKTDDKVIGTIVDIQRHDDEHDVYVTYKYKDQMYENVPINVYTSAMKVGGRIDLSIDPANPGRASVTAAGKIISFAFIGFGMIFFIIGIVLRGQLKKGWNSY